MLYKLSVVNMNRPDFILSRISGKILDVGFNSGTLHRKIKEKFKNDVFGIDTVIKKETECYKEADASKKIPFPDNYFDTIVAGEVIEHMKKPEGFIQEAYRVLKKDGRIIITTPNRLSLINRIFRSYYAPLHFTLFAEKELAGLLESKGFRIIESVYFPFTPESCDNSRYPELFLFRKTLHHIIPKNLREDMIFVCKK